MVYTVAGGDTLQSISLALAALVNGNAKPWKAASITADVPITGAFNIHYLVAPTIARTVGGAATETVTLGSPDDAVKRCKASCASKWTGSLREQHFDPAFHLTAR